MFYILFSLLALAAPASDAPVPERARVVSVYDGDTFTLDTGDKVRLRWINTPERTKKEPFWEEAQQLAERVLLNKPVELIVAEGKERDGYGRLLAGVTDGRTNLTIALLEAGLGHVFIIPPDDTDFAPYLAAQKVAKDRMRGIWATEDFRGTLHITSFHNNARGLDEQNVNGEYLRLCNITDSTLDVDGYTITNLAGQTFTFPQMEIPAGHTVMIVSGRGYHQRDPAKQLVIQLGSGLPVWDNFREKAVIRDRDGKLVDEMSIQRKSKPSR